MTPEVEKLVKIVRERIRVTGIGATPIETLIIRENDEAAASNSHTVGRLPRKGDNMETKWFSQEEANGNVRHRLYKRNTQMGAWGQTPYFVDSAASSVHYTYGKKHGLYGSGMGSLVASANVPYRIAACFGGYSKLSEAKKAAEQRLQADMALPSDNGGELHNQTFGLQGSALIRHAAGKA